MSNRNFVHRWLVGGESIDVVRNLAEDFLVVWCEFGLGPGAVDEDLVSAPRLQREWLRIAQQIFDLRGIGRGDSGGLRRDLNDRIEIAAGCGAP